MKTPTPKNSTLKWPVHAVILFLALGLGFFLLNESHTSRQLDPDTYYHLALARESTPWWRSIATLPSVEDLGWGQYFPDKEFLFHSLLKLALPLTGENLLFAIPLLVLAAALALAFSWLCSSWTVSLFASSLLLLGTQAWVQRMLLLRPHLIAVALLVLLSAALYKQKTKWVFSLCALFPLFYHGVYLPLGTLLLYAILYREWRTPALAIAALLAGTVVNPYFPSNLTATWMHLKIATGLGLNTDTYSLGIELVRIPVPELLLQFICPIGAFALATLYLFKSKKENAFLIAVTACWWLFGFFQPRALELAVPFSALLLSICLSQKPRHLLVLGLSIILLQMPQAWDFIKWKRAQGPALNPPAALALALSLTPPGSKIYHCSWHWGSYLLYARPDLRFVDLLDPNFLYIYNAKVFRLRQLLNAGKLAHPELALQEVFKADYILCEDWFGLTKQLASNPAYQPVVSPPALGARLFSHK